MTGQSSNLDRIALIGFGEAAQAFVSGWERSGSRCVSAYDIKTQYTSQIAEMEARFRDNQVVGYAAIGNALAEAQAIFSVVTADRALEAAMAAAAHLSSGALWLDCNSCAPDTKRRAAEVIEAGGGRYIDVAVMAPVHPKRHLVPLLISGPHAEAGAQALRALGMQPRIVGEKVGDASSIKMLRSVMIKGLEALSAECFLAARRAGVEAEVLASLEASDPAIEWRKRGSYNLERMMVHGGRRAAEMREVEATIAALGLSGRMSAASAAWQDEVAAVRVEAGDVDLVTRLDRLLERL